ncbi:MAG: response regulator [Verrucomicrobiae bacterium]|nr:response regulator [Verrucomicrobiae bacterium]MCP5532406.1 response regulator [Akkermansiaceae bacterium]MCP5542651.1 response regulator [Akkermansiaceae bacterium]MCP5548236.1 response regulator [Akkermansiaceae bacterium]
MPETVQTIGLQSEAELRKEFRDYENSVGVPTARRATLIVGVFVLGGALMDWQVFPEHFWAFLLIRAICTLVLVGIYFLINTWSSAGLFNLIAYGIATPPVIAICLMIAWTGGAVSSYYAGLNLVMVGLSMLWRWSFWNSLVMVLFVLASYYTSVLVAPGPTSLPLLVNNSWFLLVTSVFVVTGNFFYERLRFQEFSLRTEVERSRELLESQNRQLSELDEAKTRFFANISHELRTPLTIMLGITEKVKSAISRQPLDPSMHEMVTMLEQNGLRLLKLIDDLLDLVRFDTGHADIQRQPTPIANHLEGMLRSLRHLAEQDRVALLWDCKSDSEAIQLDRDKFDKIVLNLVVNAIKFTPSGGSIETKVLVEDGRMRLTVADTGVGIPPEVLPRIFERFWQVDTSSTRKFQGAGIGLALVRSLAEAMGGTIKVESKLDHGTTFCVDLPTEAVADHDETAESKDDDVLKDGGNIAQLHRKAALSIPGRVAHKPATPPIHGAVPTSSPGIGTRPSGARPLVLIADDEPDIRRFLRMQMEDVDVIEASDGAEALELARLRMPQLALLDHMMPEMDGVEVCRNIRENHSTRGVAVIILTARADEQTKLSALQAGASDFLTKPFSSAELSLRLENQLAMARIRRELSDLNSELQAALEQIKENEVLMIRNEKLSALGRMSAGIIHEINNPLNYASAGIHALATFSKSLPEDDRPDFNDIVHDIQEGVERVSQIVIDLRKFTREEKSNNGDADLAEIVTRARRMVSHHLGKDITFELKTPDNALIRGNPNQLVQVFINFFQNSVDAIHQRIEADGGEPGRIDVMLEPAGEGWQVTVADNGIGIPPENIPKIFDPFFTSKDVGKGMGLGLSITHQILRAHKAMIEVDSRPGRYTRFRIVFPKFNPDDDSITPESVLDQPA